MSHGNLGLEFEGCLSHLSAKMSFPTKKAVAASMLLYCANGEKAFAPAGPAATMPRVHVPAASPAAVPFMQPQETMTWTQPVRGACCGTRRRALVWVGRATVELFLAAITTGIMA